MALPQFGLARRAERIPPYAADFTFFANNTPQMSAKEQEILLKTAKEIRGFSRKRNPPYSPEQLTRAVNRGMRIIDKY